MDVVSEENSIFVQENVTAKLLAVFTEDGGEVIWIHSYAKHVTQRTGNESQQQLQYDHAVLFRIQLVEILSITHRNRNHLHIHVQFARAILANDFITVLKRIFLVGERFVVIAELLLRKGEKEPSLVSQSFVRKELNGKEG